jgi:hypothetical protein
MYPALRRIDIHGARRSVGKIRQLASPPAWYLAIVRGTEERPFFVARVKWP